MFCRDVYYDIFLYISMQLVLVLFSENITELDFNPSIVKFCVRQWITTMTKTAATASMTCGYLSTALGSPGRALDDVSRRCPSDSPSPTSQPTSHVL